MFIHMLFVTAFQVAQVNSYLHAQNSTWRPGLVCASILPVCRERAHGEVP